MIEIFKILFLIIFGPSFLHKHIILMDDSWKNIYIEKLNKDIAKEAYFLLRETATFVFLKQKFPNIRTAGLEYLTTQQTYQEACYG